MSEKPRFEDPATNALYYSIVSSVRQLAGESDFSVEDMPDLFGRLKKESETAQVLIFSAYLEDKIQYLIKSHLFGIDSNRDEKAVFGSDGPLGSFSSRVLMMKHLGWISRLSAKQLASWRKIRNEFAHRAYKTSFQDQKIKDLWNQTKMDPTSFLDDVNKERPETKIREFSALSPAEQRLVHLVWLATGVLQELLIVPIARSWSVAPGDVLHGEWEDSPEPIKQLWEHTAKAVVRVATEEDA